MTSQAHDPVLTEVLANRFRGIANEMAHTIQRTAFSVFVKETQDYVAGLVAPGGEVFGFPDAAPPMLMGSNLGTAIAAIRDYEPGDVVIANDPHSTGGLMTQLNDLHVWMPFFWEGRLVCFLWDFLHLSDVGGSVPGSITLSNVDIAQEGVRLPPTKLLRQGVLDPAIAAIFRVNSRTPDLNWGDLNALLAALRLGEQRLVDTAKKYGASPLARGIEAVLAHGEARSREVIGDLPAGRYEARDHLEFSLAGESAKAQIQLAITVSEGRLHLDFAGTGEQQPAAVNLVTGGRAHADVVYGLVNFLRTADKTLPLNGGVLRPVTASIPEGSILNPRGTPAIGGRMATVIRVMDVVNACLAQAAPSLVPAAGGDPTLIFLAVRDEKRRVGVSLLQPLAGGYGARQHKDGVDGSDAATAWLRNVPTEMLEASLPILVTRYSLDNRIAHGRQRGGRGTIFEFRVLAPDCQVIARNRTRIHSRPWGLDGGEPGGVARVCINSGTPDQKDLDVLDVYNATAGDVISFTSSCGGAYGDPFARDPELVLKDARAGLLGQEAMASIYGVVVRASGASVDSEATATLRDRHQARESHHG